jgi:GT2 family glycosyltransferase
VISVVDIDVIIPTYGRPVAVNNILRMLLDQDTLPRKVIVVNQTPGVENPDQDVLKAYESAYVDLLWINRESPSFCGARNDALRSATSEICLFLDDDIIPSADLVRRHWERYQDGVDWAAVGGQVWHRLPYISTERISLHEPHSGTMPALQHSGPIIGGPLFGGHFSIRRAVALSVGGWDEAFVGSANWEEGDLINRLRTAGQSFVWDPAIWVIHLRLPSGGCRIPGNRLFPEWTKTTNFFLYKYRYPLDKSWREVLVSALRAGPLRRENVVRFWRWPSAWFGFVKGWCLGKKMARNPILPLRNTRMQEAWFLSRENR